MKVIPVVVLLATLKWVVSNETYQSSLLEIPDLGKVKGEVRKTVDNQEFYRYDNIPYAQIRESGLFQPAISIASPESVLNDGFGIPCPGLEPTINETLDYKNCLLLLQIETKSLTGKQPVIVNFPLYDLNQKSIPDHYSPHLLTKDLVLVEVRHRVGPYGFLSTLTNEIPGNMGVLDIIESLKWIQEHISHFGGDSDRITLNGHYMTAGIIAVLTKSPLSEGLFHQVIYQTGSDEMQNFTTNKPLEAAHAVALNANCSDVKGMAQLNQCLMETPVSVLFQAYTSLMEGYCDGYNVFPITLGDPIGVTNFVGKCRHYPSLGGFVDHTSVQFLKYLEKGENKEWKNEINRLTCSFAYGRFSLLMKIFGTILFEHGVRGWEDSLKEGILRNLQVNKNCGGRSYLYTFRYREKEHYIQQSKLVKKFQFFDNYSGLLDDYPFLYSDEKSDGDLKYIADLMVDLWSSFAETGFPKSTKLPEWPELSNSSGPYLIIDSNTSIEYINNWEISQFIRLKKEGDQN